MPESWCESESATPDPQDRRQLIGVETANALCHTGWAPIILTGFFRDLLVRHFSEENFIETPELRKHIWQELPPTGILIESVHKWRGDLTEKRPAITIKRNAYRNVRVSILDRTGTDEEGNENFATLWVGSHTLFCIHGTGAGVEILATEVQRELTQYSPVITKMFGLHKFKVNQVGQIGELEEATENFVIPITVGWAYEETWSLEQEALRLSAISLGFNLAC
jgi:hypothetical protein